MPYLYIALGLVLFYFLTKAAEQMEPIEVIWPILFKFTEKHAITFPYPFIFYRSDEWQNKLHEHEMGHVERLKAKGWIRYYVNYVYRYLRYGDEDHPEDASK